MIFWGWAKSDNRIRWISGIIWLSRLLINRSIQNTIKQFCAADSQIGFGELISSWNQLITSISVFFVAHIPDEAWSF